MAGVDRSKFIGMETQPFDALIETGRLKFFAKAIGETDPVYFDEKAAKAAGHRAIPVPPTFLFCLQMENPDPYALTRAMGIRIEQILHGEQHFTYHQQAYAGDRLTMKMRVSNTYSKKGGELGFVVRDTTITNEKGETVAVLSGTTVVRENM